jgi:hypothetical protein
MLSLEILAETASMKRSFRNVKKNHHGGVDNLTDEIQFAGKKRCRTPVGKVFEVEELLKSRPSKKSKMHREYLTKWKGYTRHSWNEEIDFIGSDLVKMMVMRDLKDEAPWILSSWKPRQH